MRPRTEGELMSRYVEARRMPNGDVVDVDMYDGTIRLGGYTTTEEAYCDALRLIREGRL